MIDNKKKAVRCLDNRNRTERLVKSGPNKGTALTHVPNAVKRFLHREMYAYEGLADVARRLNLPLYGALHPGR